MNYRLIGIGIITLALILCGGVLFYFISGLNTPTSNNNSSTGNPFGSGPIVSGGNPSGIPPTTGSSTPPITVTGSDGKQITVNDFKNASSTIKNPNNTQGYYIVSGTNDPQAPVPPYTIVYFDIDQSFGISLNQEPLGTVRNEAEQALMQELGIDEQSMCRLNYTLGVRPGINHLYDRKNLGFSFCPGAVALPQ